MLRVDMREIQLADLNRENLCDSCLTKRKCAIRNRWTTRYGQLEIVRCNSFAGMEQKKDTPAPLKRRAYERPVTIRRDL